jgi:tRNA-specific 2-thiouridylase
MSGGVDSSVAAALLVERGWDVIGITMKLFCYGADIPDRPCCSLDSIDDARRVCERLGIPHYVVNMERAFARDVLGDFVSEYARGRTPIPCVRCNTFTKFRDLVAKADALDAGWIATGHYARAEGGALRRGVDPHKDQSYFLWGIDRRVVGRLLLPVGDLGKAETRARARALGLTMVADKAESQDICFVPDGDHARVIAEQLGADTPALQPGPVVTRDGTVVVGDRDDLLANGAVAREINWLSDAGPRIGDRIAAQVRHRGAAVTADITRIEGTGPRGPFEIEIAFSTPLAAVTPGQSLALYDGDRLVGGGVIERALSSVPVPLSAAVQAG